MPVDRLVFVTGLSGAGKSETMKTFEDLGFYCVDNLPPNLVEQTLELLERAEIRSIAVALDVRSGGTLGEALPVLQKYAGGDTRPDVLFLDARDDVLVRRFSETRRRHPFSSVGSLREAIGLERAMVAPLRDLATHVIDTTSMTHSELKERIFSNFAPDRAEHRLNVTVVAFGFKYGIPLDVDLTFDVRFLQNPNYIEDLRPLTGADEPVAKYIENDPNLRPFVEKLFDMVEFLLPRYVEEGKAQLTIGIGCTGGRHRSVYLARRLAHRIEELGSVDVHLETRDARR